MNSPSHPAPNQAEPIEPCCDDCKEEIDEDPEKALLIKEKCLTNVKASGEWW